jgi:integral membrane protein (TIGR01906 family)
MRTAFNTILADEKPRRRSRRLLASVVIWYLTLAIPVLLILIGARLVMTPLFLQLEYSRPGFPEDIYGFTHEERMNHAGDMLDYLIYNKDLDYLGSMAFPDGTPLLNLRELQHMHDVQVVTRYAFFLLFYGGIGALVMGALLWIGRTGRYALRQGLLNGSILTLTMIGVIVVLAITAWDLFFTGFHQILFESGTWRFAYSDTLIRLFPEQFWFDAALVIGTLTALSAAIILAISWRWGNTNSK